MARKLVRGFGINDVEYSVKVSVEVDKNTSGKRCRKQVWVCPYYRKWRDMIDRCYRKGRKEFITYSDCYVDDRWKKLSDFIKWVDSQPNKDWQNCDLDKDLLVSGNKKYCPENCVFVERKVNNFFLEAASHDSEYMVGVTWHKRLNRFMAQCCDPFRRKNSSYIGYYDTETEAHLAWCQTKAIYAKELAIIQQDYRVKDKLLFFADNLDEQRKKFLRNISKL
jgi:hypothetical protein